MNKSKNAARVSRKWSKPKSRDFHHAVSSVSRHIAALEEALGQQLFYRHTRAMTLTDQLTDPVREGIDITFRVGALADSTLVARRLAAMNYVVAAAPDYLQRCGTPTRPDDLSQHDCLLYQGEMGRQRWYWNTTDQSQACTYKIDSSLYSNDAQSLVRTALMGQGGGCLPPG